MSIRFMLTYGIKTLHADEPDISALFSLVFAFPLMIRVT